MLPAFMVRTRVIALAICLLASAASAATRATPVASSHYRVARRFMKAAGLKFCRNVESRIPKEGRTLILVAMGGAEHLGKAFELYAEKRGIAKSADILYLPLMTSVIDPWYALGPDFKGRRTGVARQIPEGFMLNGSKPRGALERLSRYLNENGVLAYDTVLVLDTGLLGSVPQGILDVVRDQGAQVHVEGVLLAKDADSLNDVPIVANTDGLPRKKREQVELWARRMDYNSVRPSTRQKTREQTAFQRSAMLKHAASDDRVEVVRALPSDKDWRANYEATLEGLRDGMVNVGP